MTVEVVRGQDILEFGTKGEFVRFFNLDTNEGYRAISKGEYMGLPIYIKKTETTLKQATVEDFYLKHSDKMTNQEIIKALVKKYGVTEARAKTAMIILKRRQAIDETTSGVADVEDYKNLLAAIAEYAIKDYRSALKVLCKNPKSKTARSEKILIEHYFESTLYDLISSIDGRELAKILQKQVGYIEQEAENDKRRAERVPR